jgi:hypothetical protein
LPPGPSALPAFGEAPFGDDGPLLLEQASPGGNWVSVCQARADSNSDGHVEVNAGPRGELHGDALTRYLIAPGGRELSHDGVLGADARGRYVLLMRGGALILWDSQTDGRVDLSANGADARLSAESMSALRTADFDALGQSLLYVRLGSDGPRVVIRSLQDGSERTLEAGPGAIWRARFDRGGAFVVVELLSADSNKNGRADFPAPLLSTPRACSAGPALFHTWVERGDRPETVLLPLNGGPALHEPDLVFPVGDALLLRDESGALFLERAGKKRILAPAACKARVVHADVARDLFVLGCAQAKKTGRVSLELVGVAGRKALGIELASVESDREPDGSPRLVALYPGTDTVLLDAEKGELLPLQPGDSVLTVRAALALVRRGGALLIYDADTRTEHALPGTLDRYPQVLLSAPYAFVSPLLVNLDAAAVVGQSKRHALALSNTGQLLLSDADPDASGLTHGPLHWQTPGS